jgi:hypothetical protein
MVRAGGSYNVNVLDNTYNGNPGMTSINTNYEYAVASSGNRIPYRVHLCGNTANLYPPVPFFADYPAALAYGTWMESINLCGNTLVAGGHGIVWADRCTNAVILKNDFSTATYRSLSYLGTNGSVGTIVVAKNILSQGVSQHLRLRYEDGNAYFLIRNRYQAFGSTNQINPFIDAAASPVHFFY